MNYKAFILLAILFISQVTFADVVSSPVDIAIPLIVLGIIGIIGFGIIAVGIVTIYFVYKYIQKQNKSSPIESTVKVKGKKK
jgi:hypothetical protein